ncbi:DUF3046 domain-containing protein [Corynebacterium crudilactis]|uniref:DUF3046 domain-containing protein n=1 Tax=Corynebacterium crudilactis TaxID=1652495 RepID=A0A172QXI2_9CORY|nr:DUF3046 domain-containing protein [Corynebacterium crudilactis]ANE05348.1 hypothetical protein ccrud_08455 [Corynebacterium crudilactis]
MRLSEFQQLVKDEFGEAKGEWIAHSHVIGALGVTAEVAIDTGIDLRNVWEQLCIDFSIPESRRLGKDDPRF